MYVTGGQYRGRKIIIPSCAKPTLSKVREGVFNVLHSFLGNFEGKIFLDLFAGSGIMSLEAASRGFTTVSIDKNRLAFQAIKENLKISNTSKVYLISAENYVEKCSVVPDVIYLDPPWDVNYGQIFNMCYEKFRNSVITVEYDKKKTQNFCEIYAKTNTPFREKVYGRCKVDFIKVV